jgi:phospholipid/cholesterol/gamma-HCH transport system permease protein
MTTPAASAAASGATSVGSTTSAWAQQHGVWTLHLAAAATPAELVDVGLPPAQGAIDRLCIDASAWTAWDVGQAAALWTLQSRWQQPGRHVEWAGLPEGLGDVLQLARPGIVAPDGVVAEPLPAPVRAVRQALHEARQTVAFVGEVILALARWSRGKARVRGRDVLHQLDQTGPRSAPIVLLSCALVGVMLAYMGGAQLDRIGAEGFLAGVVTVGMVRELAGLMTGVILSGRVGAAYAAQLATMQAGEEVDALRVLGVDPVVHLVLPRLLALLLMAPALLAFGALAGIAAGAVPAILVYGVGGAEYLQQSLRALTATHLWIGLFKGLLYAALVALAGCREGLHAGRSAEAVGQATTAAVVKALVWIVMAACATTVAFTALGY